jgi:signal transduction histidine kinase
VGRAQTARGLCASGVCQIEKLRASEHLARGQVEALRQALDAVAEESALDKLLGRILRVMSRRMGAAGASLWLREETSELPLFHLSFENGRLCTRPDARHPVRKNPAYWQENPMGRELLLTKRAVLCEDVEQDARVGAQREYLLAQGIRTVLAVPLLLGGRVIGLVSIRCERRRKYRAEEIELAQALAHQATLAIQLTRLAEQSRQAAVLEERNRMTRDIHDTLAQGFTGIIVQLEAAEDATLRGETYEAANHLRRVSKLAREGLAEARRSVQALRPRALEDRNLPDALDGLIKQMTPGSGLRAELGYVGQPRPLASDQEENLLRICQEALANTLQHAEAKRFRVRLVFGLKEVRLEVSDNGRGFDPAHLNGGFGLTGMKERVSRLGGRMTIESAPGQGTRILAVLPDRGMLETSRI